MNTNEEGFSLDPIEWSEELAHDLASQDGAILTAAHIELLVTARAFYFSFDHSPAMRPLVKFIASQLGKDKGNSIYLMQLFPGSPAKFIAKYAGLPKPDKCL